MFQEESDFSHRRLTPARGENVILLHLQKCECTHVLVAPQREELYVGLQTSRSLSDSKGRFVRRTRASTETNRAAEENTGLEIAVRVLAERLSESGGPGSRTGVTGRRCCEVSLHSKWALVSTGELVGSLGGGPPPAVSPDREVCGSKKVVYHFCEDGAERQRSGKKPHKCELG